MSMLRGERSYAICPNQKLIMNQLLIRSMKSAGIVHDTLAREAEEGKGVELGTSTATSTVQARPFLST